VRIPAAFNGIVGYKSTYGRYPMAGVFPLSSSLDSLGVLCRSVADAALVDAAMRGRLAPEATRIAPKDVTLIVPTNVVFDEAEPEVVQQFERALDRLSAAGVTIERQRIAAFDAVLELGRLHGALVTAEAYTLHARRLAGPEAALMDQRVAARMRGGATMTASNVIATRDARLRLIAEMRPVLGPRTLLAHPTIPHVAPAIAPLETDDELYVRINALTLRNTMLGNFLELCGVSLPCGTGAEGLPVGFLLSAAGGLDAELLGVALELEDLIRAA
jgi:aspartyl-tRNA(Asn)/glutamyl-tRNA(Gln) amidotransferase subunit A